MNRLSRGLVVLAASVALWSCSGDPSDRFREGAARIDADPSSLFLTQGETKSIIVEVTDDQGSPLDQEVTATPGTGVTVELDPTYLPTTSTTGALTYARRFNVTGTAGVSTEVTLSSGDLTTTVPIRVLPLDVALTFSNPAPAANEEITVTAEGFTFTPEAVLVFGADTGVTTSVAEDGSSMTVLPPPGATGNPTVGGIEVNYAPGAPLTIASTTALTVAPVTPLAGTASPSTAPAIALPPVGGTTRFFDAPDFVASLDAFYRITIPAEVGSVDVTLNWNSSADIDLIRSITANCPTTFASADCDFTGATASKPEHATYTLTPGTYTIFADLFSGTAPTWIYWEITSNAPEAP